MDDEHEQDQHSSPITEEAPAREPGLRRSTKRRMIGGVAGGLGERFDIDANIVRVIFVVLTALYGLGLAIYLAMWVLIPQSGRPAGSGEDSFDDAPTSNMRLLSYALLVAVVVGALIVLSTFGGAPRAGGGLGLLWLLFLVVLAVLSLRSSARQHMLRRFIALVFLAVLTLMILVAGAALGFLAATGVSLHGGSGERLIQPSTLAEVQHNYNTEFGEMTVDLRQVHFDSSPTPVNASVAVGQLTVDVPANAIVYLKTHIGIGSIQYVSEFGDSIQPFRAIPPSLKSAASQRSAPHLDLDVQVGVGQIIVRRGAN